MDLRLKLPPVAVVLVAGLLMWAVARLVPAGRWEFAAAPLFATVLAAAALAIAVAALVGFARARTTVKPHRPEEVSALVTAGVYRVSRNPMYLALLLLLAAWAVRLQHPPAGVFLPVFVAYMNRFQIEPEEAALRQRFGRGFDEYRQRVRRWL